jgi:transposase
MIDLPEVLARRADLAALAAQGPAALIGRVLELEQELAEAQRRRVPIGDSRTTHAPPSSDPRPKPRSQRRKSQRRPGGQPGHPGHRLEPTPKPDHIQRHVVGRCGACGVDLTREPVTQVRKHQVFDLPPTPLVVVEHQLESKRCPCCAAVTQAPPPPGAEQPTQYGARLAAFVVYLHSAQFLPLQRITGLIAQLTGHQLSEAWIKTCHARLSARLDSFLVAVTAALRAAKTVCCDETGFRFTGRRFWLHVCCTSALTLLGCHRRRGTPGIGALGILPAYTGIAVHDHWSPYFKFSCQHAVCNEHHIRELAAASEPIGQTWAVDLQQVLYDALELKRRYHGNGQLIPAPQIATLIARYAAGLRAGYAANPPSPPTGPPKRGRRPRGKTLSLLDRLRDRQVETLRCLHDPHVPWCNNQAEQDIRMMKVQQKISGGFRTEQGAIDFCRIRSYLSTLQKNQINLFDGIVHALADKPWLPSQLPSAAHEKMSCSHDQEKIAA